MKYAAKKLRTISINAIKQLGKPGNSEFAYTTRSMCSFVVMHSPPIIMKSSSLLAISLVRGDDNSVGARLLPDMHSCEVELLVDIGQGYLTKSAEQKNESVIFWIESALESCYVAGFISGEAMESVRRVVADAGSRGYRHCYGVARPSASPSGKLRAFIEVNHKSDVATGELVVLSKSGGEMFRELVFRERPDELLFDHWRVRPVWLDENRVRIVPKMGMAPPVDFLVVD